MTCDRTKFRLVTNTKICNGSTASKLARDSCKIKNSSRSSRGGAVSISVRYSNYEFSISIEYSTLFGYQQ